MTTKNAQAFKNSPEFKNTDMDKALLRMIEKGLVIWKPNKGFALTPLGEQEKLRQMKLNPQS